MKNILCSLVAAFAFTACNHSNPEIKKRIADSDSMAINYFRGDGTMDTVVSVKIVRDKQQIVQLATLVGERSAEKNYKCGFDGSLHFFKMNQVIQDVDFRMNAADCMYFTFLQNGSQQATALSNEAKEMLTRFREMPAPKTGK